MDPLDSGDEELRRRLEAYADLRLRPDDEAMSRIRARLITTASQRSPVAPQLTVVPGARRRWRVALATLAAAAALVIAVGGAAAMSGPGQAFYGARLWVEQATLPSDPAQRAEAELRRIETRLSEAQAAAGHGDQRAVSAALAAYEGIVNETVGDAGADTDRVAHLETELSKHIDVLARLAGTVPASAQGAIQHAIEQSSKALVKLHDKSNGGTERERQRQRERERQRERQRERNGNGNGGPDASPGNPQPSTGPDASHGNPHPSTGPDASHGNPHPSTGPDASHGNPNASHAPGGPDGSPGKPSPKPDKSVKP